MKECTNCGAKHHDGAKFCTVCGSALPKPVTPPPTSLTPPPTSSPAPHQHPPSLPSVQSPPATVISPTPARGSSRWFSSWSIHGRVLAEGRVSIVDPPRDARLPFDPVRLIVMLSVILFFIGILVISFTVALALFIVLLIFGLGSICLLPFLIPVLGGIFGPILYILRGRQNAALQDFQIEDEISAKPISAVIYLKEGTSIIHLGDRVRVFGRRRWGMNTIRAFRIEILETGGQATRYVVHGIRPWPWWLTLLVIGIIFWGAVALRGWYASI